MSVRLLEESLFTGRIIEGFINLAVGAPGPDTLRRAGEVFELASINRMKQVKESDYSLFQYGPVSGYTGYLQQLAKFLSEEYSEQVHSDSLILTCGATHGLHLAATILLQPAHDKIIFVESPTYFIAIDILKKDMNCTIVPIPMEADGLNVEALEFAIKERFKEDFKACSGKFWAMFYTIPTFHNPTGTLLHSVKCEKLIRVARKYDLLIFCDDVYNLLYFDDNIKKCPRRLLSFDDPGDDDYESGRVISNGTFSKILAPGIRVGWIEAGPRIIETLRDSGILSSGGSVNNVMSGIIASAIETDSMTSHVKELRKLYGERVKAIKALFDQNLSKNFKCLYPLGGYFLWVVGPKNFDARKFSDFCRDNFQVFVLPGEACSSGEITCRNDRPTIECSNSFRISFAYYQTLDLQRGIERICKALRNFT